MHGNAIFIDTAAPFHVESQPEALSGSHICILCASLLLLISSRSHELCAIVDIRLSMLHALIIPRDSLQSNNNDYDLVAISLDNISALNYATTTN